ncbi:CPCC family cysteine-rich protein [Terrabacter sp. GCM10028922]|uniref:CPCC family cysteine-rich protein n=1 Tax=Terrabacter sp. GCM10028922 TaxID=3273428 RepID=UPI00361B0318
MLWTPDLTERDAYELCPVCFWEDDPNESRAPGFAGGANGVSIVDAQQTYLRLGAMHPAFVNKVRPPRPNEARLADLQQYETSGVESEPAITRLEAGERLGVASWRITYKIFQGDLVKGKGPDPLMAYVTQSSVQEELAWQANAGPLQRIGRWFRHMFQWF